MQRFWLDVVLSLAFVGYSGATLRWSHHWRPLGWEPMEYLVGAVLIVGAAWLRGPYPTWEDGLAQLIVNYCIAGAVVFPAHICHAISGRAAAARRRAERSAHDGDEPT